MVVGAIPLADVQAAIVEDGHLFDEMDLLEDDGFEDDESLELQCALDCLLQCGVPWEKLRGETVQKILDQYRAFLQVDLF
jgi:hypothetical protein